MARKTLNRIELRVAGEAAEQLAASEGGATKGAEKKPVKKKATRTKQVKEVRYKLYWGVYNQSLKRVAIFEYAEHPKAVKKAEELSTNQKTPHFVQHFKEAIQE